MNLQRIEQGLNHIASEASFILHINNKLEHEQALTLMEQLIEDYDKHEPLIDLLCISIEKYENTADEFQEFNQRLSEMDSGVSALVTLMDQHGLNTTDFSNEIGGKSLVSMILNQKRPLNLGHIRKLADRFNVPAQIFI
jgi:HTH-type transcriptional regulator / antitoxin HigA